MKQAILLAILLSSRSTGNTINPTITGSAINPYIGAFDSSLGTLTGVHLAIGATVGSTYQFQTTPQYVTGQNSFVSADVEGVLNSTILGNLGATLFSSNGSLIFHDIDTVSPDAVTILDASGMVSTNTDWISGLDPFLSGWSILMQGSIGYQNVFWPPAGVQMTDANVVFAPVFLGVTYDYDPDPLTLIPEPSSRFLIGVAILMFAVKILWRVRGTRV